MAVFDDTFAVKTSKRNQMINITGQVMDVVRSSGLTDGLVTVFTPHTTAGITINENADPDVTHDILMTLDQLFPQDRPGYRHYEGNSDSHVKSSLIGASEQIMLKNSLLVLGTWQGIYFCEFDGPRSRKVTVQVLL